MELENIKVSVITPCYNNEKEILETIESVLTQSHENIELIVVDDCSKDKSVEIIQNVKDDRIKLIRNEKNMGAAFSRNIALKAATGDYIAFLDGDDLWMKDKIQKQLKFMIDNNIVFSYTCYKQIDFNGNALFIRGPRFVTHKMFLKCCLVGCLTVMYKRSVYPDLEVPSDIYKRNDYAMWIKLSKRADCYLLNEILAIYRKGKGLSSGSKVKLIKHHYRLFRKLLGVNALKASTLTIRNIFYYCFYKKRFVFKYDSHKK